MSKERVSLIKSHDGSNYLFAFILVTSLFFLWGFAHSLLDVLNKHFQELLGISKAKSGLIQFALYGGYFVMGIPAGLFMNKFGFKKGIILGLLVYAIGCFMFIPAAQIQTFEFTLVCLFVIACGLTFLETAANPYSTVLGPKESSVQRLNLSQSFNGLGWVAGPLVGGLLIFGASSSENKFASLSIPYIIVGSFVLLVALLFIVAKLPVIKDGGHGSEINGTVVATKPSMWDYPHFKWAIFIQFLYVAAQTGINSFFINYVTETTPSISNQTAAYILAIGGMGLFWFGRTTGSFMMQFFSPNKLLGIYGTISVVSMIIVIAGLGWFSFVALFITYFCMSIMFPTIFALGIKDLGEHTKKASSYLIMGVVGGAICPMFMGWFAGITNMAISFVIPLICFAFIAMFGYKWSKVR